MALYGSPINPDELKAAIDMASDRPALVDQWKRTWARWYAAHPDCMYLCAKCGKRIECGYLLLPEGNVRLCPSHVEHRWV